MTVHELSCVDARRIAVRAQLLDRKAGVLQVNAIHQDVTFDKTMTAAVDHQIKDLAHWLGLKLMPR